MKKQFLVIMLVLMGFCFVGGNTNAQPFLGSSSFDFPSEFSIGDTIDFSAQIDMIGMDSLFSGYQFDITLSLYNDADTIQLCSGSVELQNGGILIYQFSCEIPDDIDLGQYSLLIELNTPTGMFVVSQGQSVQVDGNFDINSDGSLDIADLVYLVQFMFANGPPPQPGLSNADLNCDRQNDISDLITMIQFMFNDGTLPCYSNPGI